MRALFWDKDQGRDPYNVLGWGKIEANNFSLYLSHFEEDENTRSWLKFHDGGKVTEY